MRASTVMFLAIAASVLTRWANNEQAVPTGKAVVEWVFAILVIAALDQGRTEPIAKGFAWLFLASVLLSAPKGKKALLTSLGSATTTARSKAPKVTAV